MVYVNACETFAVMSLQRQCRSPSSTATAKQHYKYTGFFIWKQPHLTLNVILSIPKYIYIYNIQTCTIMTHSTSYKLYTLLIILLLSWPSLLGCLAIPPCKSVSSGRYVVVKQGVSVTPFPKVFYIILTTRNLE